MIAILATPPVAWAIAGERMRATLLWLALGLALGRFRRRSSRPLDRPRYGIVSVDAFSILHVRGHFPRGRGGS